MVLGCQNIELWANMTLKSQINTHLERLCPLIYYTDQNNANYEAKIASCIKFSKHFLDYLRNKCLEHFLSKYLYTKVYFKH